MTDCANRTHAPNDLIECNRELELKLNTATTVLRDMIHRVKNNLQVVSSLLRLQSQRLADPEAKSALAECGERVRAMALVYEQLSLASQAAEIGFGEYVRSLGRGVLSSYGASSRVEFHEDAEVHLPLQQAIPCGLIIQELISNSLKHAFPNGRTGGIWVDLRREDDLLTLHYRDNGVGFSGAIDLDQATSLGLQLVGDLTAQLDGEYEFHGAGGADFQMRFPSRKAAAASA